MEDREYVLFLKKHEFELGLIVGSILTIILYELVA